MTSVVLSGQNNNKRKKIETYYAKYHYETQFYVTGQFPHISSGNHTYTALLSNPRRNFSEDDEQLGR